VPDSPSSVGPIESLPERLERELGQLLGPAEMVLCKAKGAFKEAVVCTESRVIILKGGFMTGQMLGNNSFQQPYSNIAGVQVSYHLMSGYFEVSAGGMQNVAKSYWSSGEGSDPAKAPNCVSLNSKSQAERFRQIAAFILAMVDETRHSPTVATPSPADDPLIILERLGKLHEAGVLSEEEFLTKKAEMLGRL